MYICGSKQSFSQEVRLAAINALINALDFIKENFDREVSSFILCAKGDNSNTS